MANTNVFIVRHNMKYYFYLILSVYVCAAIFSEGYLQADEHYQIMQFAAYKLQLTTSLHLPWEFFDQIRPTIQTFFVVQLYHGLQWITGSNDVNPFTIALITRFFAMTLSLFSAYWFYFSFKNELKNKTLQRWMLFLSFLSYLVVFNGVRFSSENISGKLFIISLCLIWVMNQKNQRSLGLYFLGGLLLGLSFVVRYQTAFMIFGLMTWLLFIRKLEIKYVTLLCAGIITIFLAGVVIDHWFYGDWVFTSWKYFEFNILKHRAAEFGVTPWYHYAGVMQYIPYTVAYVICTFYFIFYFRKHVVTWIIVPFLFVHLIIGHKEFRFLTPLLPLMPLVVMLSIQTWKERGYVQSRYWFWLTRGAYYLNSVALLFVMFLPARDLTIYHLLYRQYTNPVTFYVLSARSNENSTIPNDTTLDFYLRKNANGKCVKNLSDVHCSSREYCLLMLNCEQVKIFQPQLSRYQLIASQCPAWIDRMNWGHWQSRTYLLKNIYSVALTT